MSHLIKGYCPHCGQPIMYEFEKREDYITGPKGIMVLNMYRGSHLHDDGLVCMALMTKSKEEENGTESDTH